MSIPRSLRPASQPHRPGGMRDRHGRGLRGPSALPGPLSPRGVAYPGTAAQRFDALVLSLVAELERRWGNQWGQVEFGVEETPLIPADWSSDAPLATLVRGHGARASRIVLFRRPIAWRAPTRPEMSAMVLAVLIEQVAELLGIEPHEVDPRYES
ncbi:MAG TPA: metallopeptidase family protein [Nocardioidaceae bacterium]|nr:metallopeptidase family protein [Nocardioidaceae bacterium]